METAPKSGPREQKKGHYEAHLGERLISKGPGYDDVVKAAEALGLMGNEALTIRWVRPKGAICVF